MIVHREDPLRILKILKWPDPFLSLIPEVVTVFDDALEEDLRNMFVTMYADNGIGLAANQVGIDKSMFVMDTSISGDKRQVYINPEIISKSDAIQDFVEGCLSFPGGSVTMKRSMKLTVNAVDEKNVPFTKELQGLDAICFQHEFDHLCGTTFADHLSPLKKQMLQKKMIKFSRKK